MKPNPLLEAAGHGRHSKLYLWMYDNHDMLVAMWAQGHGRNWRALCKFCAQTGLTDAKGHAPTVNTLKQTWYRVTWRIYWENAPPGLEFAREVPAPATAPAPALVAPPPTRPAPAAVEEVAPALPTPEAVEAQIARFQQRLKQYRW